MINKMKAAVFKDIENIVVEEILVPECPEEGVLVKVISCGICGSDVRNYSSGLRDNIKNQIIGHEIGGIIEEVGGRVKNYKVRDRLAIAPDISCGECIYCRMNFPNLCANHKMIGAHFPGGFAQYIPLTKEILQKGIIHKMPENISYDEAALSEPLSSVVACQERVNVSLGDNVAIIGDGPIGCLHASLARARGASKIIVVGLLRLKELEKFDIDYVIDAGRQDPVEEVLKFTGGKGVDIAIVANPVASTQEQAVEMVRKRGQVVIFGGVSKQNPFTSLNSNIIHYNELSIIGSFSYHPEHHRKALEYISQKKIDSKKFINLSLPLEKIVEGILAAREGKALKVVIHPWDK